MIPRTHICEQCGRELPDGGLMMGDWSRIANHVHVALPGTYPVVRLAVKLPHPLEFCGDQCATNWLAQAIDEKLVHDNDAQLAADGQHIDRVAEILAAGALEVTL